MVASVSAEELDPGKLPPPATNHIVFDRDIQPIFEQTCFRCHGPEEPKSDFSLAFRESALQGGDDNTNDIVPGDSAKSYLIYYVARQVEDMGMPPEGRGKPLTPQQVGLLRAWIDQGATWGANSAPPPVSFAVEPTLRWIAVSGDQKKFRELEGVKEGWGGGLDHFALTNRISPDTKETVEGHALFSGRDVRIKLSLEKRNVGFVRGGFEEWRRYYDDTGGYYVSNSPPSFSLNRDMHLDIGRAWIDFGLTLPHWPKIVLGYEYQFRNGSKSTLAWGGPIDGKHIYPAAEDIDEHTHVITLDVTDDWVGWHVENNARVEIYSLQNHRDDATSYGTTFYDVTENATYLQGANTLSFEKQLKDWWLLSGGYYYSQYHGGGSQNQTSVNASGAEINGNYSQANNITLKRDSHVFSAANLFSPTKNLSVSLMAQGEWTCQSGFGDVEYGFGDPNVPGSFFVFPGTASLNLDRKKATEDLTVRFTKIPRTVLFSDARFSQEYISEFVDEIGSVPETFTRDTDAYNYLYHTRAGFSTSPWRWVEWNAHYGWRDSDTDYNHLLDESSGGGVGYPAFITHRDITTDEVQTRLVLHPTLWLKTTLTYQWVQSDFHTTTDSATNQFSGTVYSPGGEILAGKYRANIYGLSLAVTPVRQLYLSGSFTYSDTSTTTAQNGDPSIVPYRGHVYTLSASGNYVLNRKTSLQASYSFSDADYGQNNVAAGLPLGIVYTRHRLSAGISRRLTKRLSSSLRYVFYQYSEPSSGNLNNYTGNGVFATVSYNWP